jgi:hypothetical protein
MPKLVAVLALALIGGCMVESTDLLALLGSNLLFFTNAAVLWGIGRAVTSLAPAPTTPLWKLFRRTLPWHPVAAGAFIGFTWSHMLPESAGHGRIAAAIYFGASGVLAAYAHDLFRTWLKHRPKQQ